MRSLSIASTHFWDVPSSNVSSSGFDVEHNCAYVLSEKEDEAEILRIEHSTSVEDIPVPIASFPLNGRVVSARYLNEAQSLAIITKGGDIGLLSVEEESNNFEVIGSIEAGISTAGWCPDESIVVVVTGDEKVLVMTTNFDVLLEQPLHSDDPGEAQQVNVGWGSKQTQFHGSLGKAAAQATPVSLANIGSSPDDDGLSRVSWRGDGAFFVISALRTPPQGSIDRTRRVLRVYDRQGVLQNVAEPVAGLEHVLDWRPSGNLISGTQRFGFEGGGAGREGRHDIVFFERNGLRHGEFSLREQGSYKVRELMWNAESDILAVWLERDEGDIVQLWTTSNYHWCALYSLAFDGPNLPHRYLKQEIIAPKADNGSGTFTSVTWHPENGTRLLLTTRQRVLEYVFAWETFISRAQVPNDTGSVAVVDGTSLLITPFRTQNVPPPMASITLALGQPRTPVHVSFSPTGDHLAVLNHGGSVSLWDLRTRMEFGRGKALDPVLVCIFDLGSEVCQPRQICLQENPAAPKTFRISVLACESIADVAFVAVVADKVFQGQKEIEMPGKDGRLVYSTAGIYWQSSEGKIFSVSTSGEGAALVTEFPNFCFTAEAVSLPESSSLFIGRTDSGKLYCTSPNANSPYFLAPNSSSMAISAGFVIYTTTSHESFFAPLENLHVITSTAVMNGSSDASTQPQSQWEHRRVERGSRIVTAVPSNMSLVLQMPRGNLETINPRPMVLVVVKQDIETKNYRKAFLACRKHRIDLSILVEHDPTAFLENVSSFVEQIDDVDYLNLFLTGLGQTSLDSMKITEYYDALRVELESRDLTKYVNSILTVYVVKKPADYEAALSLLLRIREIDSELVEEAVKYVIFLVDADRLFDTALGMYDFSLVLLIAQHSQRDPREYLPFLRELRALPKFYQRYRIDDQLKRNPKALENLNLAGPDYFDEAILYIEKHRLYTSAFQLWKNDVERHRRILDVYGDYLFERREFRQAAIVFIEARSSSKALVAYERALLWREALELAIRVGTDETSLNELAHRLADELLSKKKFEEAARLLLDHAKNLRLCINALVQGNMFSEARRIVALHGEQTLLEEIVQPALLDSRTQFSEDIEEMRTQLRKQTERLRELRVKKTEEPDAFYGLDDDPTLHSVDVMTDVSMAPTAFTRYTVAPTTASKASKRTSRSKRKMERKVGSGRKGTIDEEEYLLRSIGKLVVRFDEVQNDAAQILPHLLQFSPEHRNEAHSLQSELSVFRAELQVVLNEAWPAKNGNATDGTGETNSSSWAERMEEKKRERTRAVESVVKPEMGVNDMSWKVDILHV
ncbi:IkappaB kinase complex, IKAP component [Fomitiporia mediterranea MF3/22]|uniref:IkappaB kinase complex, IKAP component n=1 Tax=Fomitiporia mediterranea (strain MF3/22) TaxID=694068 RepID=UPI0004409CC3|nr:IkappaB kinase complex, IKAP component [Fomitiporia mediterranea MF3/22]EJD08171.1 IkappaB kinase complex, IKAP component [Fomitiporia mediterranea MF3/22]